MALDIRSAVKFKLQAHRSSSSQRQCQPCNDATDSCIGYAYNYRPVCYNLCYLPFGVRWYEQAMGGVQASDWTLTTNVDGTVTLSNQPVVPGPNQMQITLPDLNYTVSLKPSVCDLFGLSGVPSQPNSDVHLFNTLYIVTAIDDLATTWTLEPLRVADACAGDLIQIEHYRSPYADNQRRVVRLTNVVCPLEIWEWRDTQIKQLVNCLQIFIRCVLLPKRCECRSKSTRCSQQSCMRRKVEWSSRSNRDEFEDGSRRASRKPADMALYAASRKRLTGFLHKIPSTRLHLRRSIHEANINLAPEPKSVDKRLIQTTSDHLRDMTLQTYQDDSEDSYPYRYTNGLLDGNFFG